MTDEAVTDEAVTADAVTHQPEEMPAANCCGPTAYRLAFQLMGDAVLARGAVLTALAAWRTEQRGPGARGQLTVAPRLVGTVPRPPACAHGPGLLVQVHRIAAAHTRCGGRRRTGPSQLERQLLTARKTAMPALGRAEAVRQSLRALPAEGRRILILAYFGGYTTGEIASLTGVRRAEALSGLSTSLQALRRR